MRYIGLDLALTTAHKALVIDERVLALFVVDNSESPFEALKEAGLKRFATQWGSLARIGCAIFLDLPP